MRNIKITEEIQQQQLRSGWGGRCDVEKSVTAQQLLERSPAAVPAGQRSGRSRWRLSCSCHVQDIGGVPGSQLWPQQAHVLKACEEWASG